MKILTKILDSKRGELPLLRRMKLPEPPGNVPPFVGPRAPGAALSLICEIKRRSPSAGQLSTKLTVSERACAYEAGGASALSILCDGPFFDGAFSHLTEARAGSTLPLLCKEFIIDECQLDAAHAYGASAALLIVRCLARGQLASLIAATVSRKMTPVVEVFTEDEAKLALDSGATFIGVNARDLDTLEMDAERAVQVISHLPQSVTAAHLSGVKTDEDVKRVAKGRADAALIGEVLMQQDDPVATLKALAQAAR